MAWVSGVSAATLAMWLLVLTSRLRHSFGSDSTCIRLGLGLGLGFGLALALALGLGPSL